MTHIKRPFRLCDLFFDNGYGRYWYMWIEFQYSLDALARRDEFEGKLAWAEGKRLAKVGRHYESVLNDLQWRLRRYKEHTWWVVMLAEWVHSFKRQLVM